MARRLTWLFLPLGIAPLALASSCSSESGPDYYRGGGGRDTGSSGNAGSASRAGAPPVAPGGDPNCPSPTPIDETKLCGDELIPVAVKKPNLYFLLDVSGSMAELIEPRRTKLDASKDALAHVVETHGHRLNYGLATFPSSAEECARGREIFSTREGDELKCGEFVKGPVYRRFMRTLDDVESSGGTPLSPTLDAIESRLRGLSGPTSLVLLTDGAPNCNADAECDANECSLSIAHVEIGDVSCGPKVNCCDRRLVQDWVSDPGSYCLDRQASVDLVQDLFDAGITTYVVGVPGVEVAHDLMNELARAGGAGRGGATAYFDVRDETELDVALSTISALVAQPCALELEDPPEDAVELNVYLDGIVLPSLSKNGWGYRDGKVTLLGESCERVQRGEVEEIRVVSGCDLVLY